MHRLTMPAPHRRYWLTRQYARDYLQNLRLGDTRIEVDLHPLRVRRCTITVPDLRFGHGQVLSVRGTPGARQIHLPELGEARLAILRDKSAGFYVNTLLDRQYIIIHRSICDSMGDRFLKDLQATTDSLFPHPAATVRRSFHGTTMGKRASSDRYARSLKQSQPSVSNLGMEL